MDLKTISLLCAGLLAISGCGRPQKFEINGKLAGANRDSLILEEMAEKALERRKVLITDAEGNFSFSDTAGNPRLLFLKTSMNEYITLMVLGGEKISLSAEKGRINETITVSGSPQTTLVMELNQATRMASLKLDSLSRQYEALRGKGNDPELDAWLMREYQALADGQRSFIRSFIDKHPGDPASLLALSHQVGQQQVLNGSEDFDLFKKVDSQLQKKYPKSVLSLNLHKYVEAMRLQVEAAEAQSKLTGTGKVAPDITLPDPDGKTIALSSFRGKIVLLDFWAAWCGPCRRENPNLVAAYNKYHDKGFEIYQVSLDKNREEWVGAIKKDELNWTHVSDLKFWSSPVAQQYGVQSIPANFLLDREGKIIGGNLRGAALDQELDKLFR